MSVESDNMSPRNKNPSTMVNMDKISEKFLPLNGDDTFISNPFKTSHLFPTGWQQEIVETIASETVYRGRTPTSPTSRESASVRYVKTGTVSTEVISNRLPWLKNLYRKEFLRLAEEVSHEAVVLSKEEAININIQSGNMRHEAHVDPNPIQGILYLTTHLESEGGETVVANNPNASTKEEIDEDCQVFCPKAGQIVFFDSRRHPYYVRPLTNPEDWHINVSVSYYTSSCTEVSRPRDTHLYGRMQASSYPSAAASYDAILESLIAESFVKSDARN